jgi:hypothetical protein
MRLKAIPVEVKSVRVAQVMNMRRAHVAIPYCTVSKLEQRCPDVRRRRVARGTFVTTWTVRLFGLNLTLYYKYRSNNIVLMRKNGLYLPEVCLTALTAAFYRFASSSPSSAHVEFGRRHFSFSPAHMTSICSIICLLQVT